jgi:transposase
MELINARKLGPSELHERRKQAVVLYQKGMTRTEIAPVVGAHRNTVGQWIRRWQDGGAKALKPARPGRPTGSGRRLSPEQEKAIRQCITDRCPDQLKLPFALWTRDAVRQLIAQDYGIDLPIRTVGWYLKRWGFTPQKPVRRAYERSEPAVQRWLADEYPAIKRKARHEGAEIHWGDEMGLRSDDVNGRGYAPKGRTPVRRAKGSPEKMNMISTVTNQGKVRFMFYRERMNAKMLIRFLRRLIRSADQKVFLILDNLRVHHARVVKAWVLLHADQIELFYLPSYSPDLNPDEYLNCDVKALVSKRPDSRRKGTLARTSLGAMRSIQKQPHRVRKYFEAKSIVYAA